MVKNIDMELDKADVADNFNNEPEENIWDKPPVEAQEDPEDDMPAFLRRRKKNKE